MTTGQRSASAPVGLTAGQALQGRQSALGFLGKGGNIMRWARIERNGSPSYAVVEGDTVIPVRGSPFDAWERTPERLKLDAVKLLVPVIPPTFYAAGMNYPEHVREVAEKVGQKP